MDHLLSYLRASGESTRLRILGLLGQGELTVSELVEILGQSQPRVSRHLRLLVEANLLSRFREGTWVFYRLSDHGPARKFIDQLLPLIMKNPGDLDRDLEKLKYMRFERAELASKYFQDNAQQWDSIRSLYVPEKLVEEALISKSGDHKNGSILDIGTGTGRILEVFSPYAKRCVGIDLSKEMLAVARKTLSEKGFSNCDLRVGDMYTLPVEAASKDLILFHQVLHYADEPLQAIREASRCLNDQGAILIADFAPHQLEFLRDDHAHRRLGFSDEEVTTWARSTGLSMMDVQLFSGDQLDVKIWQLQKEKRS